LKVLYSFKPNNNKTHDGSTFIVGEAKPVNSVMNFKLYEILTLKNIKINFI